MRTKNPFVLTSFLGVLFVLNLVAGEKKMQDNAKSDANTYAMKLSENEIKEKLGQDSLAYRVTRKDDTEPPFKNEFWDSKEEGIYVDVLTGEPLFSSTHKFDSGTGWPSFYEVIDEKYIVRKKDFKLIWPRTELRSKNANNHLGHVFSDGPKPTGLRYCINSAALRFVKKENMAKEGYGEYLNLFEQKK